LTHRRNPSLAGLLAAMLLLASGPLMAHDYATVDRVLFVQSCLRENPGPQFEMIHKCSCVLDRLAEQLSYEDFVELSTDTNATSIGGERGAVLRDNEGVQKNVRRFRQMQTDAKKACMVRPADPR
jgi:hypothetical protein